MTSRVNNLENRMDRMDRKLWWLLALTLLNLLLRFFSNLH